MEGLRNEGLATHLHNAAAALPEDVERIGVWPAELGGPLGILLEKGGTTDPMDRRPIWLMAMLYRVWASRRSRDWAQWRLGWEGGTEFRGADTLAWDVSLSMEAAAANGDEFGLLALGWRKAYDGIDLQTLRDTLERAKVPNWARLPLMDMYKRDRRIRVGTVI